MYLIKQSICKPSNVHRKEVKRNQKKVSKVDYYTCSLFFNDYVFAFFPAIGTPTWYCTYDL